MAGRPSNASSVGASSLLRQLAWDTWCHIGTTLRSWTFDHHGVSCMLDKFIYGSFEGSNRIDRSILVLGATSSCT